MQCVVRGSGDAPLTRGPERGCSFGQEGVEGDDGVGHEVPVAGLQPFDEHPHDVCSQGPIQDLSARSNCFMNAHTHTRTHTHT